MVNITEKNIQEFVDAAEMLFGRVVANRIDRWIQSDANRISSLPSLSVQAAIASLSEALGDPETAAFRYESGPDPWPEFLWKSTAWNPFPGNSTALAILAVIANRMVEHASHKEAFGAHELAQESVAYYLAWTDRLIRTQSSAIYLITRDFLDKVKGGKADEVASRIASLSKDLVGEISNVGDTADSISFVINAMLILREHREERAPLTFDIELPVTASWQLLWKIASDGGINPESETMSAVADLLEELEPKQVTMQKASARRLSNMVQMMQDGAKLLGRGVAEVTFRADRTAADELGPMELSTLWRSHEDAPLSLLYSLGWRHPNHESYDKKDLPRIRLALHGSGTISITNSNDPLIEFFAGGWRYVDLDAKTDVFLAHLEQSGTSLDREGIYRLFRFSHHLGSHHHGATVAVSTAPLAPTSRLKDFWDQWGLEDHLESAVDAAKQNEVEFDQHCIPLMFNGNTDIVRIGRMAYCMALHDGMTTIGVKPKQEAYQITDFRDFPGFLKDRIDSERAAVETKHEIRLPNKLKYGSRHRAAFVHSQEETIDFVLCISQDGFVTAFTKGVPLQVR